MFIVIDVLNVAKISFFMLIFIISNSVVMDLLWPSDDVSQQTVTDTWTTSTILRLVVLYMWSTMLLIYFFW